MRQPETTVADAAAGAAAGREQRREYPGDGAQPGEHGAALETAAHQAAVGGDSGARAGAQGERGIPGHAGR